MASAEEIEKLVALGLTDANKQKGLFEIIQKFHDDSIDTHQAKTDMCWNLIEAYYNLIKKTADNYDFNLVSNMLQSCADSGLLFFVNQKELIQYLLKLFKILIMGKVAKPPPQTQPVDLPDTSKVPTSPNPPIVLFLIIFKSIILVMENSQEHGQLETVLRHVSDICSLWETSFFELLTQYSLSLFLRHSDSFASDSSTHEFVYTTKSYKQISYLFDLLHNALHFHKSIFCSVLTFESWRTILANMLDHDSLWTSLLHNHQFNTVSNIVSIIEILCLQPFIGRFVDNVANNIKSETLFELIGNIERKKLCFLRVCMRFEFLLITSVQYTQYHFEQEKQQVTAAGGNSSWRSGRSDGSDDDAVHRTESDCLLHCLVTISRVANHLLQHTDRALASQSAVDSNLRVFIMKHYAMICRVCDESSSDCSSKYPSQSSSSSGGAESVSSAARAGTLVLTSTHEAIQTIRLVCLATLLILCRVSALIFYDVKSFTLDCFVLLFSEFNTVYTAKHTLVNATNLHMVQPIFEGLFSQVTRFDSLLCEQLTLVLQSRYREILTLTRGWKKLRSAISDECSEACMVHLLQQTTTNNSNPPLRHVTVISADIYRSTLPASLVKSASSEHQSAYRYYQTATSASIQIITASLSVFTELLMVRHQGTLNRGGGHHLNKLSGNHPLKRKLSCDRQQEYTLSSSMKHAMLLTLMQLLVCLKSCDDVDYLLKCGSNFDTTATATANSYSKGVKDHSNAALDTSTTTKHSVQPAPVSIVRGFPSDVAVTAASMHANTKNAMRNTASDDESSNNFMISDLHAQSLKMILLSMSLGLLDQSYLQTQLSPSGSGWGLQRGQSTAAAAARGVDDSTEITFSVYTSAKQAHLYEAGQVFDYCCVLMHRAVGLSERPVDKLETTTDYITSTRCPLSVSLWNHTQLVVRILCINQGNNFFQAIMSNAFEFRSLHSRLLSTSLHCLFSKQCSTADDLKSKLFNLIKFLYIFIYQSYETYTYPHSHCGRLDETKDSKSSHYEDVSYICTILMPVIQRARNNIQIPVSVAAEAAAESVSVAAEASYGCEEIADVFAQFLFAFNVDDSDDEEEEEKMTVEDDTHHKMLVNDIVLVILFHLQPSLALRLVYHFTLTTDDYADNADNTPHSNSSVNNASDGRNTFQYEDVDDWASSPRRQGEVKHQKDATEKRILQAMQSEVIILGRSNDQQGRLSDNKFSMQAMEQGLNLCDINILSQTLFKEVDADAHVRDLLKYVFPLALTRMETDSSRIRTKAHYPQVGRDIQSETHARIDGSSHYANCSSARTGMKRVAEVRVLNVSAAVFTVYLLGLAQVPSLNCRVDTDRQSHSHSTDSAAEEASAAFPLSQSVYLVCKEDISRYWDSLAANESHTDNLDKTACNYLFYHISKVALQFVRQFISMWLGNIRGRRASNSAQLSLSPSEYCVSTQGVLLAFPSHAHLPELCDFYMRTAHDAMNRYLDIIKYSSKIDSQASRRKVFEMISVLLHPYSSLSSSLPATSSCSVSSSSSSMRGIVCNITSDGEPYLNALSKSFKDFSLLFASVNLGEEQATRLCMRDTLLRMVILINRLTLFRITQRPLEMKSVNCDPHHHRQLRHANAHALDDAINSDSGSDDIIRRTKPSYEHQASRSSAIDTTFEAFDRLIAVCRDWCSRSEHSSLHIANHGQLVEIDCFFVSLKSHEGADSDVSHRGCFLLLSLCNNIGMHIICGFTTTHCDSLDSSKYFLLASSWIHAWRVLIDRLRARKSSSQATNSQHISSSTCAVGYTLLRLLGQRNAAIVHSIQDWAHEGMSVVANGLSLPHALSQLYSQSYRVDAYEVFVDRLHTICCGMEAVVCAGLWLAQLCSLTEVDSTSISSSMSSSDLKKVNRELEMCIRTLLLKCQEMLVLADLYLSTKDGEVDDDNHNIKFLLRRLQSYVNVFCSSRQVIAIVEINSCNAWSRAIPLCLVSSSGETAVDSGNASMRASSSDVPSSNSDSSDLKRTSSVKPFNEPKPYKTVYDCTTHILEVTWKTRSCGIDLDSSDDKSQSKCAEVVGLLNPYDDILTFLKSDV